jgi:hypothetical protein
MPPRHELNDRFHGHIRRAHRVRAASTAFLAGLTVLAVVGSAALAFHEIAPEKFAALTRGDARAAQPAAAGAIGDALYKIVCTILRNCPENIATNSATSPQNVKPQQPPSKPYSYQATTSPNVKSPTIEHSAPTAGGATATQVAVSSNPVPVAGSSAFPAPPTTIIERVVSGGVNTSYVDAQISLLQNSLLQRIAGMENANATSFRNVSSSLAASNLTGTITNAIESAVGTILDLTSNTLTVTNDADVGGDLTVAGDATFGGTLTAGSLSVSALSSGGAVEAPYFAATSSSATSTFSGALNLAATASNGAGAILSSGSLYIHNAGSNNFFAGVNAGNLSPTGTTNVGVGVSALSPRRRRREGGQHDRPVVERCAHFPGRQHTRPSREQFGQRSADNSQWRQRGRSDHLALAHVVSHRHHRLRWPHGLDGRRLALPR